MILDAIGQRILSNPTWRERVLDVARRSYEQLQRERPGELQATQKALAEVDRRMKRLIDNAEVEIIPDLQERYAQRKAERDALQAKLAKLQQDFGRHVEPPTEEWIEKQLAGLRSLLMGHVPAAAHVLRGLVGGRIVVHEIRLHAKLRHYLQGRIEVRLYAVMEGVGMADSDEGADELTETIVVDFRQPPRFEEVADEVKRLRTRAPPSRTSARRSGAATR